MNAPLRFTPVLDASASAIPAAEADSPPVTAAADQAALTKAAEPYVERWSARRVLAFLFFGSCAMWALIVWGVLRLAETL